MPHSELAVRQPAELAAGIFQCAGRNVRRSRAQLLGADDAYLATDCGTINSRAACRLASAVSRANSDSPARLCEPPVYPPTRRSLSLSLSHTRARARRASAIQTDNKWSRLSDTEPARAAWQCVFYRIQPAHTCINGLAKCVRCV